MRLPRRVLVACLAAVAAFTTTMPARATAAPPPAADRVTLTPSTPQTTFFVEATYPPPPGETCKAKHRKPLRARYRGALEVIRTADGRLALIDALTFPQYLAGIAEVPRSWPAEALKAQVVAARSYALYQVAHPRGQGRYLGYDICSTDQCQVFRGVSIEQGAFGDAWVKAIAETSGEALVHQGAAIQAFYFSTSTGRTKTNTEAFGGRALPYFRPVSGEDADAPLARWTAKMPLADLTATLVRAKQWSGPQIASVSLSGDTVSFSGGGRSAKLSRKAFRKALNDEAPCAFPGRYPGPGPVGRPLPLTVPGPEYTVAVSGGALTITGRGWGHGVGMSQWGARSLAARGRTYEQVLAHFYAGMKPTKIAEPGSIRVLAVDGASEIRIRVEGQATVKSATGSTYGPMAAVAFTGGEALGVHRGEGPKLAAVLRVTQSVPEPRALGAGESATIGYVLSAPAEVRLVFMRAGQEAGATAVAPQEIGSNTMTFTATEAFGDPPASGETAVVIEAYDGIDRVRTEPQTIAFAAPTPTPTPTPTPRAAPPSGGDGIPAGAVAGGGAALLAALGLAAALLRRRSRA